MSCNNSLDGWIPPPSNKFDLFSFTKILNGFKAGAVDGHVRHVEDSASIRYYCVVAI